MPEQIRTASPEVLYLAHPKGKLHLLECWYFQDTVEPVAATTE
jgi:hypothetical protein